MPRVAPADPIARMHPDNAAGIARSQDEADARSLAFPDIGDYAIIGDCCTSALVSSSGAIEWLCLPTFSSPSLFAALLDRKLGGNFTIQPAGPFTTRRRYLDGTAVLETTFSTASGTVRLTDFMAIDGIGKPWKVELRPARELVRLIECIDGSVEILACIEPRPEYGRKAAPGILRPHFGWVFTMQGAALTLATDMQLEPTQSGTRLAGREILQADDMRSFGLGFDIHEIAVRPATGARARTALDSTIRWWHGWVSHCTYDGVQRDLVVRSAITLKLLTYALSGAVLAAATTSLPESIGAGRNFDYRFCWLRDAAFTMRAFLGLGFRGEADAFLDWMLNATRLTRPSLKILYDVHGRNNAAEQELDHLSGYRGSKPVRVGNAAADQLQLDTYGAVVLSAYDYICLVGKLRSEEMALLRDFGEVVCRRWQEPDHGLWEMRGTPRHFTATKVLCWATLDRIIRLAEQGMLRVPLEKFRDNRDQIAAAIEAHAYNEARRAYTAELDAGDAGALDAAVLLMGWSRYGDPSRERMRNTVERIEEELGCDGLLKRYPAGYDGDTSVEGAFSACSAWAAILAARQGDVAKSGAILERLAATANDVGLFTEEYDPGGNAALGNVPQAFTHAGLITAMLELGDAMRRLQGN